MLGPLPPPIGGIAVLNKLLCSKLKQEGVNLTVINTRAGVTSRKHKRLLNRIIRFIIVVSEMISNWRKFDILHIHSTAGVGAFFLNGFWIITAKIFGKKTVLTMHGSKAQKLLPKLGKFGVLILNKANRVSTPSDYLVEYFQKKGIYKWILVPNFLDDKKFGAKSRIKANPLLLNVIKRSGEYQNTDKLIEPFRIIQTKYPQAKLEFIGSFREQQHLNRIVEQNGIEGINFVGSVDYKDMPEYYKRADIYINVPDFESFGLTIVEAFLSGLPVIATDVGGVGQLVKHGENGYLIKRGHWDEIVKYVSMLTDDPELYRLMSGNALKTGEKYTWKNLREKYYEFYTS